MPWDLSYIWSKCDPNVSKTSKYHPEHLNLICTGWSYHNYNEPHLKSTKISPQMAALQGLLARS